MDRDKPPRQKRRPPMTVKYDGPFQFEFITAALPAGTKTTCWIRAFVRSDAGDIGPVVVIASELRRGPSVTNAAEFIAAQFCEKTGINRHVMLWFEHYPKVPEERTFEESMDLVVFDPSHQHPSRQHGLGDPRWLPVEKAWVEQLIGQPLKEIPDMPIEREAEATT
jgi:hypothetical protein